MTISLPRFKGLESAQHSTPLFPLSCDTDAKSMGADSCLFLTLRGIVLCIGMGCRAIRVKSDSTIIINPCAYLLDGRVSPFQSVPVLPRGEKKRGPSATLHERSEPHNHPRHHAKSTSETSTHQPSTLPSFVCLSWPVSSHLHTP